jgi:ABC-type bacteriocin/lantibiotic exporter with double-glycine peptidase domain
MDIDLDTVGEKRSTCMNAIEITDGAFGWDEHSDPVIQNINLRIPSGSLVLVVGPVGCGKSTLLKAMLGEVPQSTGIVKLSRQKIAYCDQTPWIVNGTFKENITMFSDPDDLLYSTALHACGLQHDLTQLSGGDSSNLGSKGITLSGGQKQRLVTSPSRGNISLHANKPGSH